MITTAELSTHGPRRVGLVLARFPVPSQLFIYDLAAALIEAGLDIDLLALNGPEPGGSLDDPAIARLARHVRMPTSPAPYIRAALASPRALALALSAPARWSAIAREGALFRAVGRYDLVHAQFGPLGLACLRHIQLGNLRTRGLIVHLRGSDVTAFVQDRGARVYDALFRQADLFVANSAFFRDRAVALGCPPDKVVIVGSPIDTTFFAPPATPRDGADDGALRLVAVGRLVEKKGFLDAVDAVAQLVADGRDVTLDILGEGPERPKLEDRIARVGIGGKVRLHGVARRDQVLAALHAADIALAPSVTAASGDADAPVNTLKEAMATGLPVVATRHGGIPELVIPGENGALVPERDPTALARAIADLADRRSDWARLGKAGRRKVVSEYAREAIVRRMLETYSAALQGTVTS